MSRSHRRVALSPVPSLSPSPNNILPPHPQDVVRIFTRNTGLLFTAAKGTHEGTGRFAENVVSWLLCRSPPALLPPQH